MNFEIPPGLTDLLQEFTVAVLRTRPANLEAFAADYFNNLNGRRNDEGKTRLTFDDTATVTIQGGSAGQNPDDDDDIDNEPPPPRSGRRKSVSAERYDPEQDADDDVQKVVHPKSDDQRKRLYDATKNILLFRALDKEQMNEVLDAMFEKVVNPGDEIIKQGEDGDNFYIIDSDTSGSGNGKYDIFVDVEGKNKMVGNYNNEGFFGELALMYNQPRAATIVASSRGSIWALDRATFRRIVLKSAFIKRKKYEELIEQVSIFKSLDVYERMNVCDALSSGSFKDGERIIEQGAQADCMYFLEEGSVRVAMLNKSDPNASAEQEISRIEKGGYFGELALVTNKPRAASVYAVGAVKCAVLNVGAFERLMGPCMDIMKRNIDDYESQMVKVFGDKANISDLR